MAEPFYTEGVEIAILVAEETRVIELKSSHQHPEVGDDTGFSTSPSRSHWRKRVSKAQAKRLRKEANQETLQVSNPPLRPAKDVLNRIRHDPLLSEDEYVIDYHDRHMPNVMEIDVASWKGGGDVTDEEWIPQHRILYFRRKDEGGRKTWDRVRRLDRIFGSGTLETEKHAELVCDVLSGHENPEGRIKEQSDKPQHDNG